MFKEIGQKEYMNFIGNLMRSGKYSLVNKSNNGYKLCCINEKEEIVAYREKDNEKGIFRNYIKE